jgi:hypothetical protein
MTRNDRDTIKQVTSLLFDKDYINTIDPSIIQCENNFRLTNDVSSHPFTGCCLLSSVEFLKRSNHPEDFRVFNTSDFSVTEASHKNNYTKMVTWKAKHYWLKNIKSGEIIDITKEQFDKCFDEEKKRFGFHRYNEGVPVFPVYNEEKQLAGFYIDDATRPVDELRNRVKELGYQTAV